MPSISPGTICPLRSAFQWRGCNNEISAENCQTKPLSTSVSTKIGSDLSARHADNQVRSFQGSEDNRYAVPSGTRRGRASRLQISGRGSALSASRMAVKEGSKPQTAPKWILLFELLPHLL